MSIAFMAVATSSMAQSLNKMNWLNEPQQWEIKDGKTLVMDVPAKTDFWRISHYGFTVDDGPFYYATYGGEFEAKVKITGNYVTTFDQMGLMLRIDHENWIKAGVEYVDGKQNVSAVVTHRTSDWSVVQLPDAPRSIWIKAVRRLDAVEIFFSRDDKEYSNHSIFRHDNFIGCFSADKIKMPARKYFCFNIPVYKNMVEEPSCRSPYHKEYIRTGASGNPEDLCH